MPAELLYQSGTPAMQIFIEQTQLHPNPNIYIIYLQSMELPNQSQPLPEDAIKDKKKKNKIKS